MANRLLVYGTSPGLSSMYTPPFHRKVIPWLYAALFVVVAPVVVFYTAGYRYNVKKAAIEKRGTLITNSLPTGATIFLDGQDSGAETPAVFQELTPGSHRVRFEKEGYFPWEKTLEIRPERVTFADQAHLWRTTSTASLIMSGTSVRLAANPDLDTLAVFGNGAATGTGKLLLVQANGRISFEATVTSTLPTETVLAWQEESRALLLDGPGPRDTVVRLVRNGAVTTSTPAQATWQGTELVAPSVGTTWHWNSRSGLAFMEAQATSVRERIGNFVLPAVTTGSPQLLVDRTFSNRAFSLPAGIWSFRYNLPNALILQDGRRWLGINPQETSSFLGLIESEPPRWHEPTDGAQRGLFLGKNELWLWDAGLTPTLLIRQSEPVQAVAWHQSGEAVFLATKKTIEVLDLDERGGRVRHTLATFDEIHDLDALGKTLYVAGQKDGLTGLWALTVE